MKTAYPFLCAGAWTESEDLADVQYPYTGKVVHRVCRAGPEHIEAALAGAVRGFQATKALKTWEKTRILDGTIEHLREEQETLAQTITLECGKPITQARGEIDRTIQTLEISAEEARRIGGEILPLDWYEAGSGYTAFIRRVPRGPVLGITPFNYPLNLACHKLGPAIAAGNPIILKPSSQTPRTALMLGEAVLEAGMPPEAVSVLPCTTGHAQALATDSRIAYGSFTGSPAVGWHLKACAGATPMGLELGGNAATIIHDDADPERAAERIAVGGFANAGQVCISVQRVFVQEKVLNAFLDLLLPKVGALHTGDPMDTKTDVGPMISPSAAAMAQSKVNEAVAGGATLLTGGTVKGTLFTPTVLAHTRPEMAVNATEIFAPVITVTPYREFADAITQANATPYGLQMGVFTHDIRRIQYAVTHAEVGGLIINDISTFRADHMPYGGAKHSGAGKEGPRFAIEEMTEQRLIVIRN